MFVNEIFVVEEGYVMFCNKMFVFLQNFILFSYV